VFILLFALNALASLEAYFLFLPCSLILYTKVSHIYYLIVLMVIGKIKLILYGK